MEDVKTVPPSANNLGDQAKHPKTTTNEAPRYATTTTATPTTTTTHHIHPQPNTPSSAKALNFPNISTSNLYPNASSSTPTSATTPTSQKPTTTSTAGNVNIIPTKKQLDAALKVDESSWNSLLDEEDQDKKKRIATDDQYTNSSKWNEFQQHQKRQSELEEKMKLLREQKEEERRQQSLNASHFRIDERELAKRQREEERHNKLSEDLDAEAFAKEMFE
ncbi:hypothetical protein FDP41_012041 [Naegleria fowleri]|uniref:Uncharacterized protein n=1 Tax=Naegleria fowleri TaxID=5763 RepID=A0A6A5C8V4_NAEFO|nr:uncharacterized protein FDP41_012041 [Naegleria fowleri]KAF0982180.1 hypothetical protein FDP41_012041 [Naegleria fowleri]